jgi:lipopolysaccharide transport system ATP-binding protein
MSFITAKDLVIEFPIYGSHSRSLKNASLKIATGGRLATDASDQVVIRAIDQISFDWHEGDRIGLVGHNGCGKTTLLRAIVGVYEPVDGSLTVKGTIASMLSITLGMETEFSGYDNIFMRCTVLGLRTAEIRQLVDEIIEFSELGDYIYMPMRSYSSGMAMRLAFAISTSIKADIIIMDEWLSVGDADFAMKAERRLKEVVDKAKILVIATHSQTLVDMICNRVVKLEHGRVASHT